MRSTLPLVAFVLAACANTGAPPVSIMEPAATLAAAETAFAAHSVREDMRAAFLAHFADDGVFVRDGWTNSREYLKDRGAPPIVLDWRPVYVETAGSGELGLSTGPWKMTTKTNREAPAAYGQYVSVWRREGNRPWKVEVDLGIGHPEPALWEHGLETRVVQGGPARGRGDVGEAELRFAVDAQETGLRSAYANNASVGLRFYRSGAAPVIGKAAALASAQLRDEKLIWTIDRLETARSRDFGYSRGSFAAASAPGKALGYYLRVWRVENGDWRIVLDVTNPAPKS